MIFHTCGSLCGGVCQGLSNQALASETWKMGLKLLGSAAPFFGDSLTLGKLLEIIGNYNTNIRKLKGTYGFSDIF